MYIKADLHNHTLYSKDSLLHIKVLLRLAKRRGIDVIAITDHNRLTEIEKTYEEVFDIKVIRGEEVKTEKGEILALFINEEIPPGLSPEETLDIIEGQGGVAIIPHPFDTFRNKTALLLNWEPDRKIIVEVMNGRYITPAFGEAAYSYAKKYNYPMVAGSDAHTPVEVGRAYTVLRADKYDEEDVYKAIKRGSTVPAGTLSPPWVHITVPWIKTVRRVLNV